VDVNTRGPAVYHSKNMKPLAGDPSETHGVVVAMEPKEFMIRFYCQETEGSDERD